MRFRREPFVSAVVLIVLWQLASYLFPPYLFPSVFTIAREGVALISDPKLVGGAFLTFLRILVGTLGAFIIGGAIGIWMGLSDRCERYMQPLLTFNQGIPALSWVVIAVIWFKSTEFRIWFIIVMTTLPAFAFQIHDAYRAIPKDLIEMCLSFRPTRFDKFRTLIIPGIMPGILTAWKVNLGNVARVVVVAELVGATAGIGYELLLRQQLFDLAGAIAWTLVLVLFVVVSQGAVTFIEASVLRYRPRAERGL